MIKNPNGEFLQAKTVEDTLRCLQAGADPNTKNLEEDTPLMKSRSATCVN